MIIYKITNLVNNKIYIGQDSKNRPNYYGSGLIIRRALKRYGKHNFKKEILSDQLSSQFELNEMEKIWIQFYDAANKDKGYNITFGGEGISGKVFSEESKNKIKESRNKIIDSVSGENHWRYGKSVTEESKIRYRETWKVSRDKLFNTCYYFYLPLFTNYAKDKLLLKDIIILTTPSNFSRGLIKKVYQKIYFEVNNKKLVQHKKSKEHLINFSKNRKGIPIHNNEFKQKQSNRMEGNKNPMFNTKYKWMNKDGVNKRVNLDEIENFIKNNWTFGKIEKIIKRISLTNNIINKKVNSRRHKQISLQIAKVNEKIVNRKTDFLHKLSNQITNDYDKIFVENLQIKNMVKNHKLANSISDCNWGQFFQMLEYKSKWKDKIFEKVNPRNTSKTCNYCGNINTKLKFEEFWVCPACKKEIDRDVNASLNIEKRGLELISCEKSAESLTIVEAMKRSDTRIIPCIA